MTSKQYSAIVMWICIALGFGMGLWSYLASAPTSLAIERGLWTIALEQAALWTLYISRHHLEPPPTWIRRADLIARIDRLKVEVEVERQARLN